MSTILIVKIIKKASGRQRMRLSLANAAKELATRRSAIVEVRRIVAIRVRVNGLDHSLCFFGTRLDSDADVIASQIIG